MLKVAKNYEEKLNYLVADSVLTDKAKWWQRNYEEAAIEIGRHFYNNIQLVSVNTADEVIGYFCASVDRQLNSVDSVSCIHFTDDQYMLFAKDTKKFLEYLIDKQNFKKINWSVIRGNPIEKAYDKLCEKHDGRIVGIKKYETSIRGIPHDLKMYEWVNDYFICSYCGHKEKKEQEITCWKCGCGSMIYFNPFERNNDL